MFSHGSEIWNSSLYLNYGWRDNEGEAIAAAKRKPAKLQAFSWSTKRKHVINQNFVTVFPDNLVDRPFKEIDV